MTGRLLTQYRDHIARKGMLVAIRRHTGPAGIDRPYTDTVAQGFVADYDEATLVGAIRRINQVAIILVDTLAAILPVLDTDRLMTDFEVVNGVATLVDNKVVGGQESTIKTIKRRREGQTLIALEIVAVG
jgi:hypothetical protein